MKFSSILLVTASIVCSASVAGHHPAATFSKPQVVSNASEMRLCVGGIGGVYFLAQQGTLDISFYRMELTKQPVPMRLILVSPNREVILDTVVDGKRKGEGESPIVKTDISCPVPVAGVYGFMVSATTDRYGKLLCWGFDTNCEHYLIENSCGHKDERHREPLKLMNAGTPGKVYFWPSTNAFSGSVEKLPADTPFTRILDDAGKSVFELTPDASSTAVFSFPEDASRRAPWAIDFASMQGTITLDNLTQWDKQTPFQNISLWTDKRSAWFDYFTNRKLLTPYNFRMNLPDGQKRSVNFTLFNGDRFKKHIKLAIEYPDGTKPFAEIPFSEITLRAHQNLPLPVKCTSQSVPVFCRLRITTDDGFTTYSSISIAPKEPEADYAFEKPLHLTPYCHQNAICAYCPDYPLEAQPYFDHRNQPFMQASGFIMTRRDGRWQSGRWNLPDASSSGVVFISSKIAFDKDDWVYALIRYKDVNYLAYSRDHGENFDLLHIPAYGAFDIEQFSGHNNPPGPPPFAVYKMLKNDPKRLWRAFFDCRLFIPVKKDGAITLLPPVDVSDTCIGISMHSGIPSTIASFNGKTYIIWGETTDPNDKSIPGVPTRLAVYDHELQTLTRGPVIGYGPPANDVHNTPCITIDGKGTVHALIGTHDSTFLYSHALKPESIMDGWTPALPVGEKLGQTYLGLVCDRQNNLHMVFRLGVWQPEGYQAQLAMMTKYSDSEKWTAPQAIVKAPFLNYSVFYHRFVIDRIGKLYLSFDYWSTFWFYRNDQPGNWRSLIVSNDTGKHWQMATLEGELISR